MLDSAENASFRTVLPVSDFARQVRLTLERQLAPCWLSGEISNLSYAPSGHVYFSLKDAQAQLRCTLWRSRAQTLGWRLENGQQIEVWATASLYEARGDFQLNIEQVRRAGMGSLYEQFLQLKQRLEAEGLFAPEAKRQLPAYPRRIGVVTSPQAAAWQDVQTAFARRAPHVQILLAPTPVQGDAAVPGVVSALQQLAATDCDLIIVCRGGGSLEDLWAFNAEAIARAVRACPVPVITGVGHETDFTIADFAADLRAPTPTAAAELACPNRASLQHGLEQLQQRLQRATDYALQHRAQRLDQLAARLLHPQARLDRQAEQLKNLRHRLELAARQGVESRRRLLERLAHGLHHLNPTAVLARGYSLVRDAQGHLVTSHHALTHGMPLDIQFAEGQTRVRVESA